MISTSSKHSPRLWPGVLALLLVAVVASGTVNSPTWANPPDDTPTPQTPLIEPFSFQLKEPPGGVTATVAATSVRPTAGGDWSDLMNTSFEEGVPPNELWEVQGEDIWITSTLAYSGTYSAAVEDFSGAPTTWLVYGGANGFSLDDLIDARLNFAYWLDTDEDTYFGWAASADGVSFYGARTSGRVQSWLLGSLDLKQLIGDDSVWIAFTISGDGSGSSQNIYLDDVTLRIQEPYRIHLPLIVRNYSSCPYPCLIYQDDFSDPLSGWPREHSHYGKVEIHRDYQDGTYNMEIKEEWFTAIYAMAPNVELPKNYIVQFAMRYDFWDWNADWGVIVNATGEPGACYMLTSMNASGSVMYKIRYRSSKGKETTLASGDAKKLLKNNDKWRTARVVRQGDGISFEVYKDGGWVRIKKVYDGKLDGGRVGFRIFTYEQGAEAWFDNLYVWDLGP